MKINRKEFLSIIESVLPGISKKQYSVQQGQYIIFCDNHIITYNNSIAVFYPFVSDFHCAVKAIEFHKIIKTLKDAEIDLTMSEDSIVIFTSNEKIKTKTELKIDKEIKLPFTEVPEVEHYFNIPPLFEEGLNVCKNFCIDTKNDPLCKYIYCSSHYMIATDSARVVQYDFKEELPVFYLDHTIVSKLLSYAPTSIGIAEQWNLFKNEQGVVFAQRTLDKEEVFPIVNYISEKKTDSQFSIEELLEFEGNEIIFPNEVSNLMDLCCITGGNINKVTITVKNNTLYVSNVGEQGNHKSTCKIECDSNFTFNMNPEILKESLKKESTFVLNKECGLKVERENVKQFICILPME